MKVDAGLVTTSAVGGVSLVAGTFFGFPVAALVGGFVGGLFSMSFRKPEKLSRVVTTLVMAVLAGAFGAPLLDAILEHSVLNPAVVQRTGTDVIMAVSGIVCGFGAQTLLGAALDRAVSVIKGKQKEGA